MSKLEKVEKLNSELGNIDIYLLDQIMKGNYSENDRILDVGCGGGRNMHWFIKNEYDIHGVDINQRYIDALRQEYPTLNDNFKNGDLDHLTDLDSSFDHLICNAVLHFSKNTEHFYRMFSELVRVLKSDGTLFVRMTSNIGLEQQVKEIDDGVFLLPDGSNRFLLTRSIIDEILNRFGLSQLEPTKSVNVSDLRVMTTLILIKK
ncbi:MAG: tellurite methyltransferase [Patiriisocius sp.]|jgi:tellurite methyltransferase